MALLFLITNLYINKNLIYIFKHFRFCQNNLNHIQALNNIAQNQTNEGILEYSKYQNKHPFLFATLSAIDEKQNLLKCNQTQPKWINGEFGSPLFFWELVLDVFLAAVLVAFLNYHVNSYLLYYVKFVNV